MTPCAASLTGSVLSEFAGKEHQGAVQGMASSLSAAASIIGLIGGGLLYDWMTAWVFLLSAATITLAALVAFALPHAGSGKPAGAVAGAAT